MSRQIFHTGSLTCARRRMASTRRPRRTNAAHVVLGQAPDYLGNRAFLGKAPRRPAAPPGALPTKRRSGDILRRELELWLRATLGLRSPCARRDAAESRSGPALDRGHNVAGPDTERVAG